jgi:hypothetical protein
VWQTRSQVGVAGRQPGFTHVTTGTSKQNEQQHGKKKTRPRNETTTDNPKEPRPKTGKEP